MNKISNLQAALERKSMDGFIVTDPSNRRYLTGFTGSNVMLIITQKAAVMITDYRYEEQAKAQTKGVEIILHKDHTGHKGSKSTIYKMVIEQLKRFQLKTVGIEQDSMILGLFNLLKEQNDCEF